MGAELLLFVLKLLEDIFEGEVGSKPKGRRLFTAFIGEPSCIITLWSCATSTGVAKVSTDVCGLTELWRIVELLLWFVGPDRGYLIRDEVRLGTAGRAAELDKRTGPGSAIAILEDYRTLARMPDACFLYTWGTKAPETWELPGSWDHVGNFPFSAPACGTTRHCICISRSMS